jgi:hypothetical protein
MTHKRGHRTRGRKTGARHTRRRGGGLADVTDDQKKTSLEVIEQLVPIVKNHVEKTASCGSQISGSEDAFVYLGLNQVDRYQYAATADPRKIARAQLKSIDPAKLETLYAVYGKVQPQNIAAKAARGLVRLAKEFVTNETRAKGSLKDFLWSTLQFVKKPQDASIPGLTCYGGKRVLERLGWVKASLEGKNPPPPPPEEMTPPGSPTPAGGRRTRRRRRGGDDDQGARRSRVEAMLAAQPTSPSVPPPPAPSSNPPVLSARQRAEERKARLGLLPQSSPPPPSTGSSRRRKSIRKATRRRKH